MRMLKSLAAVFMVLVLPMILFSLLKYPEYTQSSEPNECPTVTDEQVVTLRILCNGDVIEVPLETYVASVLYGEMPSKFEMEALKAQSVAIRTYTLRRILSGGKHENADLCTDPSCCQAYREPDLSAGFAKCLQASESTRGEVIIYDGNLIEATYFSCSGGKTEAAVEVWGADIPYLRSVDSPGEEDAAHFQDTCVMGLDEFASKMGISQAESISVVDYTEGGGVKSIRIGDKEFTGIDVRTSLNLRSTVFEISVLENSVLITTKGNGHRVGMSQYGAQAMALTGSNHRQILAHYYPDTQILPIEGELVNALFDKEGVI